MIFSKANLHIPTPGLLLNGFGVHAEHNAYESMFFAVLSLILSAAHTYAYSPPFSYASRIIDSFVTSEAWFTRMISDLGEQKRLERYHSEIWVGGTGDLYTVRNDESRVGTSIVFLLIVKMA
ncbi:MAG: hypothetical protein LBF43_02955 [Puniceicoccales bacterium]|jgi:hypothetical protein|nr:hypothetical protein [Puniceicoccales bacterium]